MRWCIKVINWMLDVYYPQKSKCKQSWQFYQITQHANCQIRTLTVKAVFVAVAVCYQ